MTNRRATVPGRYLWGFFTPPVVGADLRAALVANCFLGAFPPVLLRAVCFVRAIYKAQTKKNTTFNCFESSIEHHKKSNCSESSIKQTRQIEIFEREMKFNN